MALPNFPSRSEAIESEAVMRGLVFPMRDKASFQVGLNYKGGALIYVHKDQCPGAHVKITGGVEYDGSMTPRMDDDDAMAVATFVHEYITARKPELVHPEYEASRWSGFDFRATIDNEPPADMMALLVKYRPEKKPAQPKYKVGGVRKTPKATKTKKLPKRPALKPSHEMSPSQFHKNWVLENLGSADDRAKAIIPHMEKVMRYLDAKYSRGKTEYPGARVVTPGWTTPWFSDDAPKIDDADKFWAMPARMAGVQIYGGMRMDPTGDEQYKIFRLLKAHFDNIAPEIALRLT